MKISKELKIGVLVILVLAATFVIINILRGKDLLGREIQLTGHFDNVETLVASAPVQIRGYAAGRVSSVKYNKETNDFVVTCSVSKEFNIPSDSKMTIYSTSIMGGKGIRIDLGTSMDYAQDGSSLATASDSDLISSLSEGISPLLGKVSSAIDSLNMLVSSANSVLDEQNRQNVRASLAHLERTLADANKLSSTISGKSDELDSLISNLTALSEKLSPIAMKVQQTMDNLTEVSSQIASSDVKGTISDIDKAISNVNSTIEKIQDPINSILDDADKLIREIKDDPKKFIKITVF